MTETLNLIQASVGNDHKTLVMAIEEITAADGVCATLIASQNTLSNKILMDFASDQQKHDYLLPLAKGIKLCGFAITEPQADHYR